MDLSVVSWGFNAVLGVAMYLLRNTHTDIKEQLKENRQELDRLKESKMDKLDFKEFKDDLWARLDRFEDKIEQIRGK